MSARPRPVAAWAAWAVSSLVAAAGGAADEPWELLDELRRGLSAAPLVAEFEQTFVPAGFASGDVERGRVAMELPRCARWDYDEPFAKSFLLCGETAWSWNPGEAAGRRLAVDGADDPGLDLLRLDLAALRARYRAGAAETAPGTTAVEVRLTPLAAGEIVEATILFEPGPGHLLALAWTDVEGNRTRFSLSGQRPLAATALFEPPSGVEWLDD